MIDMTGAGQVTARAAAAARVIRGNPAAWDAADRLRAVADADALAAIHRQQAANRASGYERRRPSRYATASYARLSDEQDPGGMVARWWEDGPRSLVLWGESRTGKTWAAYAIANHVHARGGWVIPWTAADLSADLKPDGAEGTYERAVACDLLILDDLGRERPTDWWLEQLHRLVDARCSDERRLLVTTNIATTGEIISRYGDPIAERLIDDGALLHIQGQPRRRVAPAW